MNRGQSSLTTIFCKRTKAPPGTADADCIAYCANTGFPYLCKSALDDPQLPAREWICTHLGIACGLPVADCAVVTIEGRSDLLFGSKWQGGTESYAIALPQVMNPTVFSGTFAFDLTSNNGDRHLNNYLYLRVNGEVLIMLIDFSRALNFDGWPMAALPMPASANTMRGAVCWSNFHPFKRADADQIISVWNSLPNSKMADILAPIPEEWMAQAERDILIAWWSSDARRVRGEEAKRNLPWVS
jgi:hypothetical protein